MRRRILAHLIALAAGIAVGLSYAWIVAPVHYVDTTPVTLRADFKAQFRTAIAAAYAATGNLDRARARLHLLADPDPVQALTAQAQRMLAAGEAFEVAQQVARLAADLRTGVASIGPLPATNGAPLDQPTITGLPPQAPEITSTGAPSESPTAEAAATAEIIHAPTARPTRTPVPTPAVPFQLISQDQVCNANLTDGLLQVSVLDRNRNPMPGVELTLTWDGGQESFFTGLKPEISNGYADSVMKSGVSYALRVAGMGAAVSGLTPPACTSSGALTYTGGLKLTFQQP
jgi:hypothetical protein